MKKILLLSILVAFIAPLKAHAFLSDEQVLSYAAMPLAVSNVCDVRGVQNDQVALLVSHMNRANVPPEAFIDVFRYVPVALVLNSGRRPDFVQWVGSEVDQGVMGDELVTVMERRLTSYGEAVTVSRTTTRIRRSRPRYYNVVYEPDYIPVRVNRYCEHELLDPYALIDMPIAVANVVELGVPIGRVGGLMVQLNLGYVSPVQTVEVLRYSSPALMGIDYGQPDFVQYVYDQRVSGLTGYDLVRVVDRQLPVYGISPQIDLSSPVYYGQNTYMPSVVQNYVSPIDASFVPTRVRTRMASFAPQVAPSVAVATPMSPQVQRLLDQRGSAVVMNPAQARREIAQSMRHGRQTTAVAPAFAAPQPAIAAVHGHGRGRIATPTQTMVMHPHGPGQGKQHGRPQFNPQPVMAAPQAIQHGRGHGQGHANGHGRGRPQFNPQPVMAAPPAAVQHGHGHGQVHE
jgi:hypothetical protein